MPIFGTNSNRRAASKRTILGAIDEDKTSYQNQFQISTIEDGSPNTDKCGIKIGVDFNVPNDLDGSKYDAVALLLEDLEKGVKQHQESISIKACQALTEQQEAFFLSMTKLGKSMKNMTIRDFNNKYMDGDDVIDLVKSFFVEDDCILSDKNNPSLEDFDTYTVMETPSRDIKCKYSNSSLVTLSRVSRKGETLHEEGDLVATVLKKRRGCNDTATIDMNVGEGIYINLSDLKSFDKLDNELKSTAMAQLKILEEQMASLMAKLVN